MSGEQERLGAAVRIGEHIVLTGSCSWTEKTLVEKGDFCPRRTMSAEERLRFYAAQFPLTELDSTYYAPPAEQQARLWAERTPEGFRFDVKAYSLLTGHPTRPRTLWRDLRERLPAEAADKRNIYPQPPRPGSARGGLAPVRVRASTHARGGQARRGPVPVPAVVRAATREPCRGAGIAGAPAGLPDLRGVPFADVAGREPRP
jgi:Protein of unknown function DUF72